MGPIKVPYFNLQLEQGQRQQQRRQRRRRRRRRRREGGGGRKQKSLRQRLRIDNRAVIKSGPKLVHLRKTPLRTFAPIYRSNLP